MVILVILPRSSSSNMSCEGFLSRDVVKFTDLINFCADSDRLRSYLINCGLLRDYSGACESCSEGTVSLNKDGESWFWRCGKRSCRKKIGLRKGSFFEDSRLSFKTILCLIHAFIYRLPYDFVKLELDIGSIAFFPRIL